MDYVHISLAGIPIVAHAGAPDQSDSPLLASAIVRLGQGSAVKMSHWQKAAGTVSGNGLMPPGLDGLDYSEPMELRLTASECIVGETPLFVLTSDVRPDAVPKAYALLAGQWVATSCSLAGRDVTAAVVSGAARYMVLWQPVYTVFVSKGGKSSNTGVGWSFNWEEV